VTGSILCVGALSMDAIFRMDRLPAGPGKFLPIEAFEIAEGMASSAACAIARLGGRPLLWSAVGDDPNGARAIAAMEAEGVDCTPIPRVAGAPTAFSTVLVDRLGERLIVPFYHPALWHNPVLPVALAEGDCAAVLVDVRWPEASAMALIEACRQGLPGVLDADVAPRETLERLLPLASHIICSRPGAAVATGSDDPEDAVGALARRCDVTVLVTAGEAGAYWRLPGEASVRHTPAPQVVAVDTTAAGDVFHGAFTLGLAEGMSADALMRFASAAAAVKCTRFGGRLGAPSRAEVLALLADAASP